VESPVTWISLGLVLNLAINSVTLLFTLAQNLRLVRYLDMREWQDSQELTKRNRTP
jgi:hypothetical protein